MYLMRFQLPEDLYPVRPNRTGETHVSYFRIVKTIVFSLIFVDNSGGFVKTSKGGGRFSIFFSILLRMISKD